MELVRVEREYDSKYYEKWTLKEIRDQLYSRGLSIKGDWNTKLDRLVEDDKRHAWNVRKERDNIAVIHPELVARKSNEKQDTAYLVCPHCHLHFWVDHLEDKTQESIFDQ